MEILLYIVAGVFALLGIGFISVGSKRNFHNKILFFSGIAYLCGALCTFIFGSWWPLLIFYVCGRVVRDFLQKRNA